MQTLTTTQVQERVPFDFPVEVLKFSDAPEGEFHVVGYAATTDFDLQGDMITEEALQAATLDLLKNSTVLLNHDPKRPIGRVTKVEFDRHGLLIDALISKTEPEIIQKIKEGVLNKFSIRGQVLERERKYSAEHDRVVNFIKRLALVEASLVSVPANPEARAIGWYIANALEDCERKTQGGTPMQDKETVSKEAATAEGSAPMPQAPQAAPPTEPMPPKPESAAQPTPPPEPQMPTEPKPEPAMMEAMKDFHGFLRAQLEPVFMLLDKLAAKGGDVGAIAQQIKASLKRLAGETSYPYPSVYPYPAPQSQPLGKERLEKMVAEEVQKQVETALKAIPTLRKGLVQPEAEADEVKKQFESLPPEKKLRAALALQHGA